MKLLMVSLGCDKNLVDSEEMLGILAARGYEITDDETEAEAAVINTCCFIDSAKQESIAEIIEIGELKKTAKLKVLVVSGCMAQRYKQEILEEMPEVDAIVGTTAIDKIAQVVDDALKGRKSTLLTDISQDPEVREKRVLSTGGHYAFLKIAEGCDKYCTYCIIPKLRGHYRSVPMEKLLADAQMLADEGVKELILVAQETTLYGKDLYGEKSLHILLQKLCQIEGIRWIRILYCYPEEIYPALIETMARESKICHYLDLPIQHASDEILKKMHRRTTEADLRALVEKLRRRIPDIVLRTTLITGFPGETEEDHEKLMSFIEEMKFDRLGVFTYSREEGTPAAAMKPQIRKAVKEKRRRDLMRAQQKISLARGKGRIGRELDVMIEGYIPDEGVYEARTYGDAPGVDGFIFIETERTLMTGDFVRVRVTGSSEYDLEGVLIDEPAQ